MLMSINNKEIETNNIDVATLNLEAIKKERNIVSNKIEFRNSHIIIGSNVKRWLNSDSVQIFIDKYERIIVMKPANPLVDDDVFIINKNSGIFKNKELRDMNIKDGVCDTFLIEKQLQDCSHLVVVKYSQ